MKQVSLGRSGIVTTSVGLELGAMAGMSFADCRRVMDEAMEAGIRFYDIGLPEEELQKRIGHAAAGRRGQIILAGSFAPCDPAKLKKGLETLLRGLKTDYIDLCQIHDPDYLPRTGDSEGFFDALTQAKEAGYIRSIGITTGSYDIALHALEFGWYDTLQYPWSIESEEDDNGLMEFCHMADMGAISVPPEAFPKSGEALKRARLWQEDQEDLCALWPCIDGESLREMFTTVL